MSLVIHAPNVHRGGGRTLLADLLLAPSRPGDCLVFADQRLELPSLPAGVDILRFAPTVSGRLAAELALRARVGRDDVVLCLGNLPPLFGLRARRTVLFLQNRYLLGPLDTTEFPRGTRLRIAIERRWLRASVSNVQQIVVQSPSMAEAVRNALGVDSLVAPFAAEGFRTETTPRRDMTARPGETVFLYVASGEPHKNHRRLLKAWVLLASGGLRPRLRLTLSEQNHPELVSWIEQQCRQHGLRVDNAGLVDAVRLDDLYREADALIYPSTAESLGLPLLEAQARRLPIVASERDFVRDVVSPRETFDPESTQSIARAVRRFLGQDEPLARILTPAEFLDLVCSV